ncbi:hypothetical protein HMPREF1986_01917 [Oribacterium sp. oral taxon 078 str. F0263]|nr:hypothetical protein HMPREF1986_01917 [Oribacterium sp. oral taxon 078 str. F0263]
MRPFLIFCIGVLERSALCQGTERGRLIRKLPDPKLKTETEQAAWKGMDLWRYPYYNS